MALLCQTVNSNCQTPSKTQTDGRTDRRRESKLVHFSLKMWHLVAMILMIFWKSTDKISCIYWLLPDFYLPLNFYEASRFVRPIGWTPDRHNGRRDASLVHPSVRWFVCEMEFDTNTTLAIFYSTEQLQVNLCKNVTKIPMPYSAIKTTLE